MKSIVILTHILLCLSLCFWAPASFASETCADLFQDSMKAWASEPEQLRSVGVLKNIPDSGKESFSKSELEILFGLRERLDSSNSIGKVESPAEARLLSLIQKREIPLGSRLTLKSFEENTLLPAFKKLAYKLAFAKQHQNPEISLEDIVQSAFEGLVVALRTYRVSDTHMFSTHAQYLMVKRINQSIADLYPGSAVRGGYYLYSKVMRIYHELEAATGQKPTVEQIIQRNEELGYEDNLSVGQVERVLSQRTFARSHRLGLDLEARDSDGIANMESSRRLEIESLARDEKLGPEDFAIMKVNENMLAEALFSVTRNERERQLFGAYHGLSISKDANGKFEFREQDPQTYQELADAYYLSKERVRQIVEKTERELKRELYSNPNSRDIVLEWLW